MAQQTPMIEDRASEILATPPARISDVVKPWAERSPDHLALVETSGTWTYGQLAAVIARTQEWLLECGVRPGDRVMLLCENCRRSEERRVGKECRYGVCVGGLKKK